MGGSSEYPDNDDVGIISNVFPSMIGGVKSLARQTPDGFKDLLKNIKSKRGRAAGNMKICNDADAK